jgi:lysophospholipase L1-like esterase
MKALQMILITITALSGCAKNAAIPVLSKITDTTTITKPMTTDSVSYLALGDSYTVGQSEPAAQSFPQQLTNSLRSKTGLNVDNPTIIATTGWTTENLIDAISHSNINNRKYDFVTLLIGVNDQYQHLSQGNYRIKFLQVLNTAINFAHGDTSRVFVLSIPDWGVTPFGGGQDSVIGPQIDEFNAINKSISLKAGIHYLDITGISRDAATKPLLIAPDGLHPSAIMYGLWVDKLQPMVAARLKK